MDRSSNIVWPDVASSDFDGVGVALLDRDERVVAANAAWNQFAVANGDGSGPTGVGMSYLAVCDAVGDPASHQIAELIRSAVRGELAATAVVRVVCDAPQASRWFDAMVASRFGDEGTCLGATVVLRPVLFGPAVSGQPVADQPVAVRADLSPDPVDQSGDVDAGPGPGARRAALTLSGVLAAAGGGPDGLMVVDDSGVIADLNEALAVLAGYRARDLRGADVDVLVPPELAGRHARLRQVVALGPRTLFMGQGVPVPLRRRDGAIVPVEVTLRPVRARDRWVVLAAVRDVTARRDLLTRERLVTQALDAISDAVSVIRVTDLRRVYVNRAFLDLIGRPGGGVDETAHVQMLAPEDRGRAAAAESSVACGEASSAVVEATVVRPDGSRIPVEVHYTRWRGPQVPTSPSAPDAAAETPPTYVIAVARDIRDRLAAQERLRASQEAFRAAFEQSPIGTLLVRIEPDGRQQVVRANAAFADIVGRPLHEVKGRVDYVLAEDEQAARALAQRLLGGQRAPAAVTWRFRRADGSVGIAEVRLCLVRLPDQVGPLALVHVVDVTDRAADERRRWQRTATAEAIAAITTDVLAGIPSGRTHQQIVDAARTVFDAPHVALVMADPTGAPVVVAGTGDTTALTTEAIARWRPPAAPTATAAVLLAGSSRRTRLGPGAAAWFGTSTQPGRLLARRRPEDTPFTAEEADLFAALARQLTLAVEVAAARADQERLVLLEDRQRIARDLHDTVIQDLIAIGMMLESGLGGELDPTHRANRDALVGELQTAVGNLRASVHDLRHSGAPGRTTITLRAITAGAERTLGHPVRLTVSGPVDALPAAHAQALTAVLREALSNVVRHAHATATSVDVRVDPSRVVLTVEDNGVGIPPGAPHGDGLANMRQRAEALGGHLRLAHTPARTLLEWAVPH